MKSYLSDQSDRLAFVCKTRRRNFAFTKSAMIKLWSKRLRRLLRTWAAFKEQLRCSSIQVSMFTQSEDWKTLKNQKANSISPGRKIVCFRSSILWRYLWAVFVGLAVEMWVNKTETMLCEFYFESFLKSSLEMEAFLAALHMINRKATVLFGGFKLWQRMPQRDAGVPLRVHIGKLYGRQRSVGRVMR